MHQLSRTDARRIAVRAQLLARPRPTDLVEVVRHLTLVQLDPTAAVAPTADLVLWSRLGSSYSPADLRAALDDRRLIEHRATIRPARYLALVRAQMADWPGRGDLRDWQRSYRDWVEANDACRRADASSALTSSTDRVAGGRFTWFEMAATWRRPNTSRSSA